MEEPLKLEQRGEILIADDSRTPIVQVLGYIVQTWYVTAKSIRDLSCSSILAINLVAFKKMCGHFNRLVPSYPQYHSIMCVDSSNELSLIGARRTALLAIGKF
jgi:hypothetical protein